MAVEIITTVTAPATATAPAGPYDLTTLAIVHDELNIPTADTSNDAFLSRAITQASAAVAKYCGRVFQVEGLTDLIYIQQDPYPYQVPGGVYPLQLSRWPLVGTIESVLQTIAAGVTQTLNLGTDFTIDAERGWLIRLNQFTGVSTAWEAMPVTVSYQAGYTRSVVNESGTIPAASPYTVTVAQAASFAADEGVLYAASLTPLTAVASAPGPGEYSVGDTGVYTFNVADEGKGVLFSYEYEYLPDDLVDACLRLVTARFKGRARDPMLMEQQTQDLGTQRFWVGSAPGQNGALPPEIEALIDQYRVPVIS